MRLAVVHDWLTGMRGGERVLEEVLRVWPQADVYTLLHEPGAVSSLIEQTADGQPRRIDTSALAHLPSSVRRRYRKLLPGLAAGAWQLRLRLERERRRGRYDAVLAVSHAFAAWALPAGEHAYVLTPMRWAWDLFDLYFPQRRWGVTGRLAANAGLEVFRRLDRRAGGRIGPDRLYCISEFVRERIVRAWGRHDARLLWPPVDVDECSLAGDGLPPNRGHEWISIGAVAPNKRLADAVAAFVSNESLGRLVVVTSGPAADIDRLRAQARPSGGRVEICGSLARPALLDRLRNARGLIHPACEDFGIVVGEALACGRPVVVAPDGGAHEVLGPDPQLLGEVACAGGPGALASAVAAVEKRLQAGAWDGALARRRAREFSARRFRDAISARVTASIPGLRVELSSRDQVPC